MRFITFAKNENGVKINKKNLMLLAVYVFGDFT